MKRKGGEREGEGEGVRERGRERGGGERRVRYKKSGNTELQ